MSRDPNELSPKTLELYNAFKQKMDQYGYKFILTATYRSQVEQDALYAQGRLTLKEVNGYRVLAGLDAITFQQNRKVTWVKKSRHTDRDAFDIAMLDKDGKVTWKNAAYNPVGKIGKEVGLRWGGDFKDSKGNPMADMPHFELP